MRKYLFAVALVFGCSASLFAAGESSLRDASYDPGFIGRSGLGFLRVISSPLAIVTQGVKYISEQREATGTTTVDDIVVVAPTVGAVIGSFYVIGEICAGMCEMFSGQQFKNFAYPWEVGENDPNTVAALRKSYEDRLNAGEVGDGTEATRELVGMIAAAAVEESIHKEHKHHHKKKR